MRWINGLEHKEKIRRRENWHRWFAWFPVTVGHTEDRHKIKVWLETVERKGNLTCSILDYCWIFKYREVNDESEDC